MALDEDAALHYAEIRADLNRRGAMIGANDLVIAAHARALGLTLVTNNTVEFERVKSLTVENWTIPPRRRKLRVGIGTAAFIATRLARSRGHSFAARQTGANRNES